MYETFYGLTERPFNLTPDPKFLYLSEKHKEAFAHLLFGIKNRSGFVMVTGEIGTGKTTICRTLLGQLDDETEVAFIFNPYLSPEELLRKINEDFGIDSKADTVKGLIDELNEYLLDRAGKGKNCVLVIDEAQNLQPKVLEQIRLLSNLETETQKLIQIVLIGQPELGQHLELDELRQLNQRITARYHLTPLDPQETLQYIAYRLRVAGGRRKVRFTSGAVRTVYKMSSGVPRVINAICDRALLIGYTLEQADITPAIIKKAYKEIRGEHFRNRAKEFWKQLLPSKAFVGAAALILLAGLVLVNPMGEQIRTLVQDVLNGTPVASHSTSTSEQKDNVVDAAVPDPPADIVPSAYQEIGTQQTSLTTETPVQNTEEILAALEPIEARNAGTYALFRAWNLALLGGFPEGDTVEQIAQFAKQNGLSCESLKPTLDQLLAINLPALIRISPKDKPMWVALSAVENESWRIVAKQGEAMTLTRAEMESIYDSEAAVPWLDPTPNAPVLKQAMRNNAVKELQSNLQTLGLLPSSPSSIYDETTREAVRRLQEQCGLNVDGVAGRQTRMVLCSWLPLSPSPQLSELPIDTSAHQVAVAPATPVTNEPVTTPSQEPVPVTDGSATPEAPAPAAEASVETPTPPPASEEAAPPPAAAETETQTPPAETPIPPDAPADDSQQNTTPPVIVEELSPPSSTPSAADSGVTDEVPVEGSRNGAFTVSDPVPADRQTTDPATSGIPLIPRDNGDAAKG